MVERVARAICLSLDGPKDGRNDCKACRTAKQGQENPVTNELEGGDPREGCLGAAYMETSRAAIAALREPTEVMVKAFENNGGAYRLRGRPDLKIVWRRMIDAALAEDES